MVRDGELGLDVRAGDDFAGGHVPGSINIALSGQFASWAGTVLGLNAHPVLIADTDQQLEEARVRLARVGMEALHGYLAGGVCAWKQARLPLAHTPQIPPQKLHSHIRLTARQLPNVRP